ncbi:hypothetical protein ACGRHY_28170 [Streptomyces sp. HK10]|uniref:hypothetical protein n=1 Tax=Streptomyces sp. HK10 TaxID=3373255 RepID=UPI003747E23C
MLMRHSPSRLRADVELGEWHPELAVPLGGGTPSLPVSYAAFCHDRWPVYRRFGAVAAGSLQRGGELAVVALCGLAAHWHTALGSSSPAALAWNLLSVETAPWQTDSVRRLHRLLDRLEADALVLRYKLGLSNEQAGRAMGLPEAQFELLRNRALSNLTSPAAA